MNTPLPFRALVLGAFSVLLLPCAGVLAQTSATTSPVGFTQLPCLANSDTLISIPFTQPAAFEGAIGSISGNTITVASTPNWTTNQFVYSSGVQSNTYYAIVGPNPVVISGAVSVTNGSTTVTGSGFTPIAVGDEIIVNGLAYNVAAVASDTSLTISRAFTGTTASGLAATYDHSPKEGCYYTVTANGSNTLTVNLNGDSLSAVAAGTSVTLIPYWTLGLAFPSGNSGTSFIASTGTTPRTRQTQVLFPDLTDTGINLAPPRLIITTMELGDSPRVTAQFLTTMSFCRHRRILSFVMSRPVRRLHPRAEFTWTASLCRWIRRPLDKTTP